MNLRRLAFVPLLAAGCASSGPPIAGYNDGEHPAATAIVRNHDNVFVDTINGRAPRSHFALVGDQSYAVPAGPCTLEVVYRADRVVGVPKTLKFNAVAGHKYRLNSYVKMAFHARTIGAGGWDARLEDEAAKGFVAETRDAQK